MAEKDVMEKLLADYNDVFSDIVNVLMFQGKNVIREKDLENTKDITQYKADGKIHEQERDVSKKWTRKGSVLSLFGLEHQTEEDTDMPMRVIGYDGAAYRAQSLSGSKKRYPVVTLVLHFGTKHRWKKAKRLSDMVDVAEGLEPYFHDYGINVFDIAFLSEDQVNMFQSDFRIVADYFRQKRLNGDYKPSTQEIKHVDEVMKLMSVLTGCKKFEVNSKKIRKKGEKVTMCEMMDRILNQEKQEGRREGLKEGREEGRQQGRLSVLTELVEKGVLAIQQAAEMAGMDIASFELALKA